ncbi:MAG: histidine kinase [Treponema sp.]|jgi:two-component system sensor histidine kinase YesM|nr:histidine kinase [Treponema sp.]
MTNDLRTKLFWFSVAVVIIPMIILYLIILAFFINRSIRENQRYAYHNIVNVSQALDSAFTGLNELSLYFIANTSVRSYLVDLPSNDTYIRVNTSMQFLPFSSKYYTSTAVISDFRRSLNTGPFSDTVLTETERKKADALKGASFLSVERNDVSLIRLLRDFNRISRPLGYIKIRINQSALFELFASPDNLPETSFLLFFEDGYLIGNGEVPSEALESETLKFSNLRAVNADSRIFEAGGRNYTYSSRTIFNGKVVVVSLLDQAGLYRMDSLLLASIFAALLMSSFFVFVISAYYTKQVFDPLKQLGEIMCSIEQKDFDSDFRITGSNEITVLVDQFNLMCRRLKILNEQIYVSEIKLKEAELAVLQSEINPHFFYNTLDTIYWMSEMSNTWKISEMVRSLSKMFRITLQKTTGGLVPLPVEQEYMQCYLAIQKVRFQDDISFEFYVQEGLEDLLALKLLLQPIVENAIIHGLEPKGGGRVVINIYREDEELVYKVYDSGDPVNIDEMETLMAEENISKRGLAVRNVNTRIKMRFGDQYGLSFENPEAGGVLATIRQPLVVGRQGE